jgi:glutamate dehydrogenase/leucine dehydrogenase
VSDALLDDATLRLEDALRHAHVSEDTLELLRYPKSTLKVSIPVRMDDGSLRTSAATECATTTRAGRPRAGSATTRT